MDSRGEQIKEEGDSEYVQEWRLYVKRRIEEAKLEEKDLIAYKRTEQLAVSDVVKARILSGPGSILLGKANVFWHTTNLTVITCLPAHLGLLYAVV